MKPKRLGKGLKVLIDEDFKFDYSDKGKKFIEINIYNIHTNHKSDEQSNHHEIAPCRFIPASLGFCRMHE